MATGMLHLHNFMRWAVVLFALWTLIKMIGGMSGGKAFTKADKRPALFLLISVDIQLILGLYLFISKGWGTVLMSGGFMKIAAQRFWAMEHIVGMLIGGTLIHIGYNAIKKDIDDKAKFKKVFWFTFIGLIIIFATIPWPFREVVGRPLFPGM